MIPASFFTQLYLQNNISPGPCFPEQFESVAGSFSASEKSRQLALSDVPALVAQW